MYTSTHADANTSLIKGLGFRYTDITKMLVDTDEIQVGIQGQCL